MIKALREWQKILALDGWIITVRICRMHEMHTNDHQGECTAVYSQKCAAIRILSPEEFPQDAIVRYCAEATLVHELLHCKFIGIENESSTIESCLYEVGQHTLLEEMAKALIMAKYSINLDWFKAQQE